MAETKDIFAQLAEPMAYQLRPKTFYHLDYTGERKKQLKAGNLPDGTKGQFLAYIDARDVANRLDAVVGPENWQDSFEIVEASTHVIKAGLALKIDDAWIWKYDYGYPNSDLDEEPLKSSSSDAFKRAGVKWGIGRFLYEMDAQWLPVDKWGKPLDGGQTTPAPANNGAAHTSQAATKSPDRQVDTRTGEIVEASPACPDCGGPMWDNRANKRNPKAPDFKCKDRSCDGAIWPPKDHGDGHPREDDDMRTMSYEEEMKGKLPWDE